MLQQYKQYVRVSHCSASHSKPVDTGKETQNDGKPWVQEEECWFLGADYVLGHGTLTENAGLPPLGFK